MRSNTTFYSLGLDNSGALRRCSLEEHIKQALRACVLTRLGERRFQPRLGSRVSEYLFRPLVAQVRDDIAQAIREAIERGEPRVECLAVDVAVDKAEPGLATIQMKYRILETSKVERLSVRLQP